MEEDDHFIMGKLVACVKEKEKEVEEDQVIRWNLAVICVEENEEVVEEVDHKTCKGEGGGGGGGGGISMDDASTNISELGR